MTGHKNVLIVEDEIIIARFLKMELETNGFSIVGIAPNGEESVKLATQYSPDFTLMDINLSGKLTGIEAAEKINEKIKSKIIFMTGYKRDQFLNYSSKYSDAPVLSKPIRINQLLPHLESE